MIARVASVTPGLLTLLRTRNDDGTPELRVSFAALDDSDGWAAQVTRHDGSELSATERQHVEATLAAHAAEPIQ